MQQWKLVFILLLLAILTTWLAIISIPTSNALKVVACDVGQGDAFLVQQGNSQILIDGGPGNSVVDCLSRHIPFWERNIEVVVLTHPQLDHYEGLIDVFKRYNVKYFIASEVNSSNEGYRVLQKEVGGSRVSIQNPLPHKDIRIGLIYLDILYPSDEEDLSEDNVLGSNTTDEDPNNYSIVFELRYKNFEMLFTGDIGPEVMGEVIASGVNDVDVLKVPHHGSKNGLTAELLKASEPELAIISAGRKNRFGHPHKEVLELLENNIVKTLRTDQMGEVVIYTDGDKISY
jgi:competence protein ComEC